MILPVNSWKSLLSDFVFGKDILDEFVEEIDASRDW